MSVSTQTIKRTYNANGVNTTWEVDFPLAAGPDLHVWITSPQGVSQEVENFVLNAAHTSVQYPAPDSEQDPLAAGWTLTLVRQTPLTQEMDFIRHGVLDAEVLESGYDKLTLIAQELQAQSTQNKADISAQATQLAAEISARQTAVSAEQAARQSADSALQTALNGKQAAGDYATNTALTSGLSAKLDSSAAATTYLSQTDAAGTYLTQTNAASAYLAKTDAAGTYLTQTNAASTYLSQSSAAATYATQSALTSGLSAKQDSLTTAQLAAVNSGVTTSTLSQVQTNQENIAALDSELAANRPWQKPSDWVDIRVGAVPGSFYFLVGHSADYSIYKEFAINAEVSNSGTYDVFVDGIKKASAVASGTATTLNWQTLALESGFDVTYPSALRTHIVRVTPTSSANSLSRLSCAAATDRDQGTLWVHSTCSQAVAIYYLLYGGANYRNPLCEAFTTDQETFKTNWSEYGFAYTNLKTAPIIELTNVGGTVGTFDGTKLKKVVLKNAQGNTGAGVGYSTYAEQWECIGGSVKPNWGFFAELPNLKQIKGSFSFKNSTDCSRLFYQTKNVQTPLFLDASEGTNVTALRLGGSSTYPVQFVKGLVVSSSAPFSATGTAQIDVAYSGMDKSALITLFNSLPIVTDSQVCDVTGATGAADLEATDLAIATGKGWSVTR